MADNVTLNSMSGGDVIAADDITSVKHQRVKIEHGADGSATDVSSASPLPVDTEMAAAAAAADAFSNPTTGGVLAFLMGFNGTTWDRVDTAAGDASNSTGKLNTAPLVYNGSTYDRLRGSTTGLQVIGGLAHDAADTSANNPTKTGGRAVAHGSNPTAVAAADVTHFIANRHGVPFVIGGHPNTVTVAAAYTAAQTNQAIVTVSAGTKIVCTAFLTRADNANTADTGFYAGFATATTPTTTGVVDTHPGVAAGSGTGVGDGSGIVGIGADDEDLRITSEDPGGAFRVVAKYFTIES